MVDCGSIDNSNNKDYCNMLDTAGSEIGGQPRSRKQVRQAKNTEDTSVEAASTHPPNVLCQAIAATLSGSMHESEEIPIYKYFILKTIMSKVVYCLTFS